MRSSAASSRSSWIRPPWTRPWRSSRGSARHYEDHHRIIIPDDALEQAARLSDRYITDRFLPDKAIDVIDEAGARARIASQVPPPEVEELKEQLAEIAREKEEAIGNQDFERAAELRDEERELGQSRSASGRRPGRRSASATARRSPPRTSRSSSAGGPACP